MGTTEKINDRKYNDGKVVNTLRRYTEEERADDQSGQADDVKSLLEFFFIHVLIPFAVQPFFITIISEMLPIQITKTVFFFYKS
jgi:hypothetical protein